MYNHTTTTIKIQSVYTKNGHLGLDFEEYSHNFTLFNYEFEHIAFMRFSVS